MIGLIVTAVGAAVGAVGSAIGAGQQRRAEMIQIEANQSAQLLEAAKQRIAQKSQALQARTQNVLDLQQKAYRRQQLTQYALYGLPLFIGIAVLLSVTMRKRKRRGKK